MSKIPQAENGHGIPQANPDGPRIIFRDNPWTVYRRAESGALHTLGSFTDARHARLFDASFELLAALKAEDFFKEHGLTLRAVWDFVGENENHPALHAYMTNGGMGVMNWLKELRRSAIAKAEEAR